MIALVIRVGCGFLALIILVSVVSCSLLARLYVPAGEPVLGGIAPDARLVVTAQVAPHGGPCRISAAPCSRHALRTPRVGSCGCTAWVRARSPRCEMP